MTGTLDVLARTAAVAILAAAAGCNPCAGIVGCEVPPTIAVEGRIVETLTGAPISGAEVTLLTQEGVELARVRTSGDGHWRTVLDVSDPLTVDAIVSTPTAPSYRVTGIPLRAFHRRGDSNVMDSWVDRPNFPMLGELFRPGSPDQPIALATVVIRQTSGLPLAGQGVVGDRYEDETNDFGHFVLYGRHVFAQSKEPVTVDITVEMKDGTTAFFNGLEIVPSHVFRDPWRVLRLAAETSTGDVEIRVINSAAAGPEPPPSGRRQ